MLLKQGKPGCLSGLVFVLTGVLETIDRDETAAIIQKYGGRVTSNISRNTSYLVVGDEPGPSKIGKVSTCVHFANNSINYFIHWILFSWSQEPRFGGLNPALFIRFFGCKIPKWKSSRRNFQLWFLSQAR